MAKKNQQEDLTPPLSDEMPVVPHRVLHSGLPFYSDEGCRHQVEGAHLMILEPLDPDDSIHELDIVPCKLEYRQGMLVHFQTNHHQMWEAGWFHNPLSGKVEKTWNVVAAGFVGEVVSDETVAKNQQHIADLEARLAKKKAIPSSSAPTVN